MTIPENSYIKTIKYEDKYIDPSDLVRAQSTNAQLWAKSFMDQIGRGYFPLNSIDEGLMLSWFASAIETTKDNIYSEMRKNKKENE